MEKEDIILDTMTYFRAKTAVHRNLADLAARFLNGKAVQGRDSEITVTGYFDDGAFMVITCGGLPGGASRLYIDLYEKSGKKLARSSYDPASQKQITGIWSMRFGGRTYIMKVDIA